MRRQFNHIRDLIAPEVKLGAKKRIDSAKHLNPKILEMRTT